MISAFSWQNYEPLPCFILYSKAKFACYSSYLLTSYFCIPISYNEKASFLDDSSRRSCMSSQNHATSASSALLVRAQTWIIMILNGLPQKRTEIILSFLKLHAENCTSESFVDYDCYSISSKGFLPTGVDIMVI